MGFWTPGLISGLHMIISDPQFMLQTFELNYGVAPCPGPGDVTGWTKHGRDPHNPLESCRVGLTLEP